jgi:hypothetical protein
MGSGTKLGKVRGLGSARHGGWFSVLPRLAMFCYSRGSYCH